MKSWFFNEHWGRQLNGSWGTTDECDAKLNDVSVSCKKIIRPKSGVFIPNHGNKKRRGGNPGNTKTILALAIRLRYG
jgi:hypothetical protein